MHVFRGECFGLLLHLSDAIIQSIISVALLSYAKNNDGETRSLTRYEYE